MAEERGLEQKYLPKIMSMGLIFGCISIILSVDYLFINNLHIELIISSALFTVMLLLIRKFMHDEMRVNQ